MTQAGPHAGHRRRPGGRGEHPAHAVAGPLARRGHRRGAGLDRAQPAALDHRPDRRHQELRPRRPRLGDADLARRRRRGGARRGVRAAAAAALVGLEGQRRLDRPVAAQGDAAARSPTYAASRTPRCRTPRCAAGTSAASSTTSSSLMRRCWRTRAYGDFWSYMLLAEGAVDIAAEPELEVYDMAALDVIVREAGGTLHLARRRRTGRAAATRWPPTATCTTRRCRSSARCRRRRRPRLAADRTGFGLRAAAARRTGDDSIPIPSPERPLFSSRRLATVESNRPEVAMRIVEVLNAKAESRGHHDQPRTPASASCSPSWPSTTSVR